MEKIPLLPLKATLIRWPVCCCSSTPGELIKDLRGAKDPPDSDKDCPEITDTAAGAS